MFIAIAVAWLWITIAALALGVIFLIGDFIARLILAFIMTRQWRREDLAYQDDYPRDIR